MPLDLSLFDVEAELNFAADDEPFAVHLKGKAQSADKVGYIDINAILDKGPLPQSLQMLTAEIKDLPVEILEQFVAVKDPKLGSIFLAAVGKTIDLKLDLEKEDTRADFKLHEKVQI